MTAPPDQTEGIDSGLYDEEAPEQKEPKSVDEQNEDSAVTLIPKSLLGGKKFSPGDEVVLQIVADHGDQIEVKYASESPEGETKTEPDADSELESLNENY